MRRSDIRLLAAARSGDMLARCEVGRRYLLGTDGFSRNVATGLEHLTHASVKNHPKAVATIAENLELSELLECGHLETLRTAARSRCAAAQTKLGIWTMTRPGQGESAIRWFEAARAGGDPVAAKALMAMSNGGGSPLLALLRELTEAGGVNGAAVAVLGAQEALREHDVGRLCACLECALELSSTRRPLLWELCVATLKLATETGRKLTGLRRDVLRSSLEALADARDPHAMLLLGRALAGQSTGCIDEGCLVERPNMRAAAALLLRAADAGQSVAWFDLYRIHSDHRSSVANAQMSCFFLEKAAASGHANAQRILGGLLLSRSSSVSDCEKGVHWLYKAHSQGDPDAEHLLRTLVLPVRGALEVAQMVADAVRPTSPILAARLMLARHFGLTRQEALMIDLARCLRPWGIVTEGPPALMEHHRLYAARAVPALSEAARKAAVEAVSLFTGANQDRLAIDGNTIALEGTFRQRSDRLRYTFTRLGVREPLFFASATSTQLNTYRSGPKWAFRVRDDLRAALADAI